MSGDDRQPLRKTRRMTVMESGESPGGWGGAVALILLLILIAGIAWFLMRSGNRGATRAGVDSGVPNSVDAKGPKNGR